MYMIMMSKETFASIEKKTCTAESKYFVVGLISVVQTLKNECIYSSIFLVIPKSL